MEEFQTYCRLCLSEDHLDSMNDQVKTIVYNEFKIDVEKHKDLSGEICVTCSEFLTKINIFKTKVLKKQSLLNKIVNVKGKNTVEPNTQKKDEVSKSTSKQKELDTTERKKKGDTAVVVQASVSMVEAKADRTKSKKKSNSEHEEVTSNKSRSRRSETNTSSEVMRNSHEAPVNSNFTPPSEIPLHYPVVVKMEPGLAIPNHPCTFCGKSFYFKESLNNHHRRHHNDVFKCLHCEYFTKIRATYCRHLREHLGVRLPQKMCQSCFKVCNNSKELAEHRKAKHESVNLVCVPCHKKVTTLTELERHKKSHQIQNNKNFICKRCNRRFLNSIALKKHGCRALKFHCRKNCGKRFEFVSLMETHSNRCSGVTIFSCNHCKKNVKNLANLQRHFKTCARLSAISESRGDKSKAPLHEDANSELGKRIKKDRHSEKSKNAEKIPVEPEPRPQASSSSRKSFIQAEENGIKRSRFSPREEPIPAEKLTSSPNNPFATRAATSNKNDRQNAEENGIKRSRFSPREEPIPAEKPTSSPIDPFATTAATSNYNDRQNAEENGIKRSRFSPREEPMPAEKPTSSPIDPFATRAAISNNYHRQNFRFEDVPKTNHHLQHVYQYEPRYNTRTTTKAPSLNLPPRAGVYNPHHRMNSSFRENYHQNQHHTTAGSPSQFDLLRNDSSPIPPISRSREVQFCKVCKSSTKSHFCCNSCVRCYKNNESQYINHQRMKHSDKRAVLRGECLAKPFT